MASSQIGGGNVNDLPPAAIDILTNKLSDADKIFLGLDVISDDDKREVQIANIGTAPLNKETATFVQVFDPNGGGLSIGEYHTNIQASPDGLPTIGKIYDGNVNFTLNLPANFSLQGFGPGQDVDASGATVYINNILDGYVPAGDYQNALHSMVYNAVKNQDGNSAVRVFLPDDQTNGLQNVTIGSETDSNETIAVNMFAMNATNTLVTKNIDTVMMVGPGNLRLANESSTSTSGTSGATVGSTVAGDSFNQVIKGGAGNDTLIGGGGTDYLAGGAGADRFTFALNGNTVITDFKATDGDKIVLNRDIIDKILAGELSVDVKDQMVGGYHIADINVNGNHLVLVGIDPATLTQDMISFDL